MKLGTFAIASAALFLFTGEALASVIVVDIGGGGSFMQIQPAVDSATDGDTILVKPGSYLGFTIDGKALTVVGDVGAVPSITNIVSVINLPSTKNVTLARLHVAAVGNLANASLKITDCVGAVRCVESDFVGQNGTQSVNAGSGALLSKARDVAISGCTLSGGYGRSGHTCLFDIVGGGGQGLTLTNGSLAVHDCIISGGHGGDGGDRSAPGGVGLNIQTSTVPETVFGFTSRSNIHGGTGGNTDCPKYGCPADGGAGFRIEVITQSPASGGWVLDSMVVGGNAGLAQGGSTQCPADPGEQYSNDQPFLFSVPGLGFNIRSVAREGESLTVTFTGVPGSHVFLNDSLTTTFEAVPSWRGVLLSPFPRAAGPMREIKWGVIPASGVLTRTYNVHDLPIGEQAQTRYLQAYRVGPNGITLGSFRTLTVLDSAF